MRFRVTPRESVVRCAVCHAEDGALVSCICGTRTHVECHASGCPTIGCHGRGRDGWPRAGLPTALEAALARVASTTEEDRPSIMADAERLVHEHRDLVSWSRDDIDREFGRLLLTRVLQAVAISVAGWLVSWLIGRMG